MRLAGLWVLSLVVAAGLQQTRSVQERRRQLCRRQRVGLAAYRQCLAQTGSAKMAAGARQAIP